MGIASGFTSDRMLAIENSSVVGGFIDVNGHLLLKRKDDSQIDAGSVIGPVGPAGPITTGIVSAFAGAVAPTGWLICDGAAVSRTSYAALFAVIGVTYGAGDGALTFNLPNMKGRVLAGPDAAQTEFASIGLTGGEKTHLLTATEMPSHTHVQNSHGHTLTDNGHTHTQAAHNHIQDAHNHTQNSHNHTQDAHNHTQNSHGHTQVGHAHNPTVLTGFQAYQGGNAARTHVAAGATADRFAITGAVVTDLDYSSTTDTQTPTVNSTTATNISTTATNQATTATNQSTTATNQAATAVNNSSTTGITLASTTATNQNTGGGGAHNNLQPYLVMNYIIHV